MITRLNPTRDDLLIKKVKDLKIGDIQILNEVCEDISLLLKYDWERVKKSTSFLGETLILNIFFIITIVTISINEYTAIYNSWIFGFLHDFGILVLPFVALKGLYNELSKSQQFWRLNYFNLLYDDKNLFTCFPLFDLLFTIMYVKLLNYSIDLLKEGFKVISFNGFSDLILIALLLIFFITCIVRLIIWRKSTKPNCY